MRRQLGNTCPVRGICLPERRSVREGIERRFGGIRCVERYGISPPCLDGINAEVSIPGVIHREEYHDNRDGQASVKTGRQNI